MGLFPPTLRKDLDSIALNNFACISKGMEEISSKNRTPSSAVSIKPCFLLSAPVKAPDSCPNNSDSSIVLWMAAQLMATNILCERGPTL